MRLTKIVATLGPASESPEQLRALIQAGVNVFRLNCSHGQHERLAAMIASVREISAALDKPVALMADLQGPKFRVGELVDHQPTRLKLGQTLTFAASTEPGSAERITTNNPTLVKALQVGQHILLDDGTLELEVLERLSETELSCRVLKQGLLKEKKGINIPGLRIDISAMTEKDEIDCRFAIAHEVDFIALSFVQSARDVHRLREFIAQTHAKLFQSEMLQHQLKALPQIVAKIERPQALEEIDAIIEATDAIMVARGDLGVELRLERVPLVQKMLIEKANRAEKPVITATQMLESMIEAPVPTRAEVSDVANAVLDGSDALMLSAETAVGKYPVEVIETMGRIMLEVEQATWYAVAEDNTLDGGSMSSGTGSAYSFHETIAHAAAHAAERARAKAIVTLSYSGSMAKRISKQKPNRPILALTPYPHVYRRLGLLRGVFPVLMKLSDNTDQTLYHAESAIQSAHLFQADDTVVFCAGQTHLAGLTNILKIYRFNPDAISEIAARSFQTALQQQPEALTP